MTNATTSCSALLAAILVWTSSSLAAADGLSVQRRATATVQVSATVSSSCSFGVDANVKDIGSKPAVDVNCRNAQAPAIDSVVMSVVNADGHTTPVVVTTLNF